jgi:hypothetical protein
VTGGKREQLHSVDGFFWSDARDHMMYFTKSLRAFLDATGTPFVHLCRRTTSPRTALPNPIEPHNSILVFAVIWRFNWVGPAPYIYVWQPDSGSP